MCNLYIVMLAQVLTGVLLFRFILHEGRELHTDVLSNPHFLTMEVEEFMSLIYDE